MHNRILEALLILILSGLVLASGCSVEEQPLENKAAIIDQLYDLENDTEFISGIMDILSRKGLEVDYFKGEEITVDFYRSLPSRGYKIIIFRAHTGLLGGGPGQSEIRTYLFTSQAYSENSETFDQMTNRLGQGRYDMGKPLFAVNADFVVKSSHGSFNGAAVIMMGCSSLKNDDMAQAFVNKGASLYTGWNESVDLDYVEQATLTLLNNLYRENNTIENAVAQTMEEAGPDSESEAEMKYYPLQSGNVTFDDLLN